VILISKRSLEKDEQLDLPLNWCAERSVNDELRKDTERSANAKEHSVVALLGEAVVLEKHTGVLYKVSDYVDFHKV